jgi:hypothetical protein
MASGTLSAPTVLPPPALHVAPTQSVTGGILNAAADVTAKSREAQIETAQKMGAGQKGAARRRRKTKRGGANAPSSLLPTASSIPGVDPTDVSIRNIDNLNAVKAAATYDKAVNLPPYDPHKSGGKRTKRKSKHGRRNSRTHRRGHNKSTRNNRRSRRNV